ncbi:hypothetical protein JT358_10015 [Micrococcales bacterium 31B]|nr:hypothetical protein [Micrococcales bacterium 31B]
MNGRARARDTGRDADPLERGWGMTSPRRGAFDTRVTNLTTPTRALTIADPASVHPLHPLARTVHVAPPRSTMDLHFTLDTNGVAAIRPHGYALPGSLMSITFTLGDGEYSDVPFANDPETGLWQGGELRVAAPLTLVITATSTRESVSASTSWFAIVAPHAPAAELQVFKSPCSGLMHFLTGHGTEHRAEHVSRDVWMEHGSPEPVVVHPGFIRFPWSTDIFEVVRWNADLYDPKALTFVSTERYLQLGRPRASTVEMHKCARLVRWETSDETLVFAGGRYYQPHASQLTLAGDEQWDLRANQGFVRPRGQHAVYHVFDLRNHLGLPLSESQYEWWGSPTPRIVNTVPKRG